MNLFVGRLLWKLRTCVRDLSFIRARYLKNFGKVNLNVYSTGVELLNAGVIPGEDMLTETAFIKLAWLLGNFKKDQVKYMINDNLRGEINDRILYKDDFLK